MELRSKRVGTVLPVTALVSRDQENATFRAGELFLDWLAETNQRAWQILPLHQTHLEPNSKSVHVSSPYKGYGIGLNPNFLTTDTPQPTSTQINHFHHQHADWIDDYALFCALRDEFGTDDWTKWPADIRAYQPVAIKKWRDRLSDRIKQHLMAQCQLDLAYSRLKSKSQRLKILLIGDLPFYLPLASPLVWRYQHLFELSPAKKMNFVSGVPSGPKSHFGRQIWGHPLYKWSDQKLWPELKMLFKLRLKYLAHLFDWVRLDHAKGFYHYGAMSLISDSDDQFLPGPGEKILPNLITYCHQFKLKVFAEDTGDNLKDLRQTLKNFQVPGIKIFRFALDEKNNKVTLQYAQPQFYESQSFAYTTSHDTETLLGYLELLSPEQRHELATLAEVKYNSALKKFATGLRSALIASPAQMILLPLQDWLLTTDRINIPGTEVSHADPNWRYQMSLPIESLPPKFEGYT